MLLVGIDLNAYITQIKLNIYNVNLECGTYRGINGLTKLTQLAPDDVSITINNWLN